MLIIASNAATDDLLSLAPSEQLEKRSAMAPMPTMSEGMAARNPMTQNTRRAASGRKKRIWKKAPTPAAITHQGV